jgi:amidase
MGLGNDIGGSLRNPAFCCGISSLKPTPGRIAQAGSTSPIPPNLTAQIMSVAGPMARTVADVRAMADVLIGPDPRDPRVAPTIPLGRNLGPVRVALLPAPPGGTTSDAVQQSVRDAGRALELLGYEVEEACPPMVDDAHAVWAGLLLADLTVAIEQFRLAMSEEAIWVLQRAIDRLPAATLASSYELHQRRYVVQRAWAEFFEHFPVLVAPVWTEQAFVHDLDVADDDGEAAVSALSRFVAPMNGLGLPAVCVPTGLAGGVPLGVQVVGNAFSDDLCLDVAAAIESVLGSITPVSPWGAAVLER